MAKKMVRIENSAVINLEWHGDTMKDTDTLVSVWDRPVAIGDIYSNDKFYRDGEEVLTPLEDALRKNAEYAEALKIVGVTV